VRTHAAVLALPLAAALLTAPEPGWQLQVSGTTERLRGVSAVSGRVAWASGSNGTVIRTTDGGENWTRLPVPGGESLDFRDVEAVNEQTAYVLSIGAGEQSRIYKTTDGGRQWSLQFTNHDPKAFYDAIAFWDPANGLAVGDPVDGRFTVVTTTDGGGTWTPIPAEARPQALPGDGMFAASGTCLAVTQPGMAWIGTGGAASTRVIRSIDRGRTWNESASPVAAGTPSAGIFSIAFRDPRHGIAVGGDYRKEREPSDNLAVTDDGGATWTAPGARLRAFRSAVVFVPRPGTAGEWLAVGPAGTDVSPDGRAWTSAGDEGFHAASADPTGDGVWAVGEGGKVARRQ
jgi:photosystem II stability/assembly factor-like uncharacterized protein